MNFCLNHVPGEGSIARPADLMVKVLFYLSLGAPFSAQSIPVKELFNPLNAFVKWYLEALQRSDTGY